MIIETTRTRYAQLCLLVAAAIGFFYLETSSGGDLIAQATTRVDNLVIQGTTTATGTVTLNNSTLETVAPELEYVGRSGGWVEGIDVANALRARDYVMAARRGSYSFDDGETTSGSATLASAAQGGFSSAIVGKAIGGSGIPAGTTVLAVASATSLTLSANATATATGVRVTITDTSTLDLAYWKHRGALSPTLGIGCTPPGASHRLQVCAQDSEDAMGGLGVRVGPTQTGDALAIYDSNPVTLLAIDKSGIIRGRPDGTSGVVMRAGNAANEVAGSWTDSASTIAFGIQVVPGSNDARFRYLTGATNIWLAQSDGGFRQLGSTLGFYGASAVAQPSVTGSRGGNAALASLLTALASQGLIVDNTTP